jgi:hypothetical protein
MQEVKPGSKNDGRERRPYEPPDVEETAEFETLALACAKTAGQRACILRPGGFQNS